MAKDFATRERAVRQGSPRWVHFTAGFGAGVLATLLTGLWLLGQEAGPADGGAASQQAAQEGPGLRLDFYEIFPQLEVPLGGGYSGPAASGLEAGEAWVLQAGSFRSPEDADQLRAQLILLGLQAEVQRTRIKGRGVWHRVMAGPFGTDQARDQAQAKLARASIPFVPLKAPAKGN